jgi:hypothetical protein
MNEPSLLNSVLPLIYQHLEKLWLAVYQPQAFYARGSATMPPTGQAHEPWDIDFILLVACKETTAARAAAVTMAQIHQDFPALPLSDIRVVTADRACPQYMHALLLLGESGCLLFGKDLRPSSTFFREHRHAIFRYVQEACAARLLAFEDCKDSKEQVKRAPHLAKAVLRLGGLLRLGKQCFSRSPEECACWLQTVSPHSTVPATLLLLSLAGGVEPTELTNACRQILADVNRVFQHDMHQD